MSAREVGLGGADSLCLCVSVGVDPPRCIYIAGWFITADLPMQRPDGPTLCDLLAERAAAGVQISVLIFQELPVSLPNASAAAAEKLEALHSNIHVIRHRSRQSSRHTHWTTSSPCPCAWTGTCRTFCGATTRRWW